MKHLIALAFLLAGCHATPPPVAPTSTTPPPATTAQAVPAATCAEPPAGTQFALMVVKASAGKPTLAQAATQLGVGVEAIDCTFGVVLVGAASSGTYSVRVDASQLTGGRGTSGPFSDPKIEPMNAKG